MNHVTQALHYADMSIILVGNQQILLYQKTQIVLTFLESLKIF